MINSNSPKQNKEPTLYEFSNTTEIKATSKLNKKSSLKLILKLIFVVVFNVFFFVLGGTEHNSSVWLSYGFIHFAYFMLLATPYITRKSKSAEVFGFAIYSVSMLYFSVALVTGIIFIMIASESYTAALLVQLGMAGLYSISLISHLITNEHTAEIEEQRQPQIEYVKTATTQLKRVLEKVEDKAIKRKVERVYDAVNSSPIKSHPNVTYIETKIMTLIYELTDAVLANEKQAIISSADSLLSAINMRNSQLKNFNI
ncbi:MAG: hypothetical protein FWG63_09085 [Defluviitaleaceae bacterium]|nr:hypothetical protein [Defluviitaleaceae bacterium]